MGERQEVEVVCGRCNGKGSSLRWVNVIPQVPTPTTGAGVAVDKQVVPCPHCVGGANKLPVKSGSLTEARLRLADAAEAWIASYENEDLHDEMYAAGRFLAALRTARGEG